MLCFWLHRLRVSLHILFYSTGRCLVWVCFTFIQMLKKPFRHLRLFFLNLPFPNKIQLRFPKRTLYMNNFISDQLLRLRAEVFLRSLSRKKQPLLHKYWSHPATKMNLKSLWELLLWVAKWTVQFWMAITFVSECYR